MDAKARKQLIFEKANANSQRRGRDRFIKEAPPALGDFLCASDCIYTPETDAILEKFLPITAAGIGTPNFLPAGYSIREFAWEAKLLASLNSIEQWKKGPAYLVIRPPKFISFEEVGRYVPDLPIFLVEFRAAARNLKKIWPSSGGSVSLVSMDLSAGVVIDNYCGYLPGDFNPSEVVYEVASWSLDCSA